MSVTMATMGMFDSCCVRAAGAPPYRPEAQEHVTPFVLVKKVEIKTIHLNEYENIKVSLLNNGGNK